MEDNIYRSLLKQRIDKMLGSFTINMDPSNYRRLYRDKAFRETLNLPSAENNRVSTQVSQLQLSSHYSMIRTGHKSYNPAAHNSTTVT